MCKPRCESSPRNGDGDENKHASSSDGISGTSLDRSQGLVDELEKYQIVDGLDPFVFAIPGILDVKNLASVFLNVGFCVFFG
jgi:hypothetical protein